MMQRADRPLQTQVIIAALNEEPGIGSTISELKEHLHNPKILVVDGNSHDETAKIAKNQGAEVIYQDGKGKGDAIAKAIESTSLNVDFVIHFFFFFFFFFFFWGKCSKYWNKIPCWHGFGQ